jgi:signal transduction histidine kinase
VLTKRARHPQLALRAVELGAENFETSFRHICARTHTHALAPQRACMLQSHASIAGHEIRNPLHGVAAGLEACLSGELPPGEMRAELAAVVDGVRMIATITNDMLDLQAMRAGAFEVRAAAVAPAALVRACVRAVQPAIASPILIDIGEGVPEEVRARGGGMDCG